MTDAQEVSADLSSHHIEGYAAADAWQRHFSVPLISHVEGNLWQGGCIDGVKLPDDFMFVVSLYPWEQYRLGPETVRVERRLYDSTEVPDVEQLLQIARQVNQMREKGKTLVHCFPAGTLVGAEAAVPIEQAAQVFGHDGKRHEVLDHWERDFDGDLVVLRMCGVLPIRSTPEHPFLVVRPYVFPGGFVAKPGMASVAEVSTVAAHYSREPQWRVAEDVRVGDYLVCPPAHTSMEPCPVEWPEGPPQGRAVGPLVPDEDTAWMLGLYAADGGTTGDNSIGFTLSPNDDVDRLMRVWERMGLCADVRDFYEYVRVTINSTVVSRALRTWCGKSDRKQLPEFVFSDGWPLRAVIDGYADGDGYVEETGTITCHTISPVLVEQIRLALVSCGEFPTVSLVRRHSGYPNAKVSYKVQWNPRATQHHTARWEDMFLVPVRSVECEPYSGKVYNLEVAGSNSYTVNGVAVHNCQAGLNRSSLIVALALVLDGMSPTNAVALVRERRCEVCLCNQSFERFILGLSPSAEAA